MKAIVRNELVLLYRLDSKREKGAQVRALLEGNEIPYLDMREEHLGQPLDWWISGESARGEAAPFAGEPFEEEVMVFSGISGKRLTGLLQQLKKIPAGTVELKAVVTQHNKSWPAHALFEELSKEHRIMKRRGVLGAQIRRWEERAGQSGKAVTEEFSAALEHAKALWKQGGEATLETYNQELEALNRAGKSCFPEEEE